MARVRMLPLCVGGLMLAACSEDATTLGGPADTSAQSSTAMRVTSPTITAPTITGVDGPTAPLAVALVVLDTPGIAVLGAASTASEVVGAENAGQWASSRSFAPVGSPHDDVDGPRVGIVVLAIAADEVAPVDTRSIQVDVDGRSMSVTNDAENSLVVEASTPGGVRFGLAGLNVAEADLLALAADVIWTGERFSFTEGDVPTGWIDIGNTLSSMSFFPAASGSSTPVGGARLTYGDAELDTAQVTLTTWPIRGPDPVVEARYALDGEVELPIDVGGIGTTAFAGAGEFFNFVIWNDGIQWMALSSPTRGVDELASLVPSVRPATEQESAEILALAD